MKALGKEERKKKYTHRLALFLLRLCRKKKKWVKKKKA